MKNLLGVFVLALQFSFCVAQNCDKCFEKNENDPIKKVKSIITKYQTYKESFKDAYRLKFELRDSKIYLVFLSTQSSALEEGREVGFLFNNDSTFLVKFKSFPKTISWSDGSTAASTNEVELSIKYLKKFCAAPIKIINLYAIGSKIEVSGKKALNIQEAAMCFSDNIDPQKDLSSVSTNGNLFDEQDNGVVLVSNIPLSHKDSLCDVIPDSICNGLNQFIKISFYVDYKTLYEIKNSQAYIDAQKDYNTLQTYLHDKIFGAGWKTQFQCKNKTSFTIPANTRGSIFYSQGKLTISFPFQAQNSYGGMLYATSYTDDDGTIIDDGK